MRDAIMVALHRESKDANGKKTKKLYQVANALVDIAIGGDVPAIKEICDRIDGRPSQAITGEGGKDLFPPVDQNALAASVSGRLAELADAINKAAQERK
jgi:hypothetical protein